MSKPGEGDNNLARFTSYEAFDLDNIEKAKDKKKEEKKEKSDG